MPEITFDKYWLISRRVMPGAVGCETRRGRQTPVM
jgi:hypothetical protein